MNPKRARKWTEHQYPFVFRQAVMSEMNNVLKAPDILNENYRVVRVPSLHERITSIQQIESGEYYKKQRNLLICLFLSILMSSAILFSTTKTSHILSQKVSAAVFKVLNDFKGDFNKAIDGVATFSQSTRY
jgi:hypothetical protein